jgi:hypothetical protein
MEKTGSLNFNRYVSQLTLHTRRSVRLCHCKHGIEDDGTRSTRAIILAQTLILI